MIYWLVSAAALAGVVLNIRKHPACFAIWILTNAAWSVIDWSHGLYAQSALMAVYFGLSIWGLWRWTPRKKGDLYGKANPLWRRTSRKGAPRKSALAHSPQTFTCRLSSSSAGGW